jgi:adenine-specific DNA glycosylase
MSGASLERSCFISCLLVCRCLTADGRASASGVAYHLEERQPEVWVDTHVFRVSRRLGLIGPRVNADRAHEIFAKYVPAEWVYPLHVNLIRHGGQICHAQRPKCAQCTLYEQCAYVGSVNGQETALSGEALPQAVEGISEL